MPAPPTPTPAPAATPLFKDMKAAPKEVVVFIYDLEKFTSFLSIPDIHRDVARYLTFIDEQIRKIFTGGVSKWDTDNLSKLDAKIIHEKFLGDGVMLIVEFPTEDPAMLHAILSDICNRAWNLKQAFAKLNAAALKFMPVDDFPKRVRFGITYGTVLELTRTDNSKEYVGYPVNLAARLQKYAGSASLLVSARLPKVDDWIAEHDYVKVRAKALRSTTSELVYIDKKDFSRSQATEGEKHLFELV